MLAVLALMPGGSCAQTQTQPAQNILGGTSPNTITVNFSGLTDVLEVFGAELAGGFSVDTQAVFAGGGTTASGNITLSNAGEKIFLLSSTPPGGGLTITGQTLNRYFNSGGVNELITSYLAAPPAGSNAVSVTVVGTVNIGLVAAGLIPNNISAKLPPAVATTANVSTSASTNFGTNLTAQTLVATGSATKTVVQVRIGARQITAGVGCGAGSNTVLATLAWTAPSGTSETQATTTLSISANGAVDSGATAYQVFTLPISGAGALTYTTTSALVSTGCSTVPQYVIEASVQ